MSFFFNLFSSNEKEKLNSFKVSKSPTYKEISKIILDEHVNGALLDDIFVKYCFSTVDEFLDKYNTASFLKCQYKQKAEPEWFFKCKECNIDENAILCYDCFFGGKHVENGHSFSLIENNSARVCDCGNPSKIKEGENGFCEFHKNCTEKARKESLDKLPIFLKKDIHIFFRHLLRFISDQKYIDKELKSGPTKSNVIFTYIMLLLESSSNLTHIFAEEMANRKLDDVVTGSTNDIAPQFKLKDIRPIPFNDVDDDTVAIDSKRAVTDVSVPESLIPRTVPKQPIIKKQQSFLSKIFSNPNFLFLFHPYLGSVIDNHPNLRLVVFEEYMKNYENLFKVRDLLSSDISISMNTYYSGDKVYNDFSSGVYPSINFIELALRCHIEHYIPKLLPFYQTPSNEEIKAEVMLQTDLVLFPKLFKDIKVVKCIINDDYKFNLFFRLAAAVHKFTTLQYVDPSISTTKFLLTMECLMLKTVQEIISTCESEKDPQLMSMLFDSIAEKLVANIETIKKRKLAKRCGTTLPHDDFFQTFTYAEIPVHFPLFRILSAFLLLSKMDPMLLITKFKMTEENIVEMLTTVLLFRFCYVTYDPTDTTENITDITMTHDLHLIQVSLCLLGAKKFFLVFFNIISSIESQSLAKAFEVLISAVQERSTLTPNKENIHYHLLQGTMSGLFKNIHFRSFDAILTGITEQDICKDYVKEVCGKKDSSLLDETNWKYFDPYYPYFSLNFRQLITNNIKKNFIKYREKTDFILPSNANPPPPLLKPLPNQLKKGVSNLFNDPDFSEVIFNIFIGTLYPTFNSYDDGFELQKVIKRLLTKKLETYGQFFYLLNSAVLSFKDSILVGSSNGEEALLKEKEEIVKNLQEYFELNDNDKVNHKLLTNNIVYNLIHPYSVLLSSSSSDSETPKQQISLLDLLFKFWKDIFTCHENKTEPSIYFTQISYLLFIFNTLLELDESIFGKLFKENDIDLNKVKELRKENIDETIINNSAGIDTTAATDKNEEGQQEEQEVKGDEIKQNIDITTATTSNNKEKKLLKLLEKEIKDNQLKGKCVICKCGEENGLLSLNSYIDLSSIILQNNKFYASEDMGYPGEYEKFIETFYLNDIKPSVTQFIPFKDDPAALFACYLFYRSPSTYISSCGHRVHKKCLEKYNSTTEQVKDESLPNIYKCPECKKGCNLSIPLGKPKGIVGGEFKKTVGQLFTDLCYFDFILLMEKESRYSIDKYLWKFVLQNIETLEIKSRSTTLYNEIDDHNEYFFMSEKEFQNELETTGLLFDVVNSYADVNPDPVLPIYDVHSTFFIDPFINSSYSTFLSPDEDPYPILFHGLSLYLFNVFIHHCMMEDLVPKDQIDNVQTVTKLVLEEHDHLFKRADEKGEPIPLDAVIKDLFADQVHTYLRKLLIMCWLIQKSKQTTSVGGKKNEAIQFPIPKLSLASLDDFDACLEMINIKSIEHLFNTYLSIDISLNLYMKKKKITANIASVPQFYASYPPPQSYVTLPSFAEQPSSFVEDLKQNIEADKCKVCNKLSKSVCMFCPGGGICDTQKCVGSYVSHAYCCPSYPFGFYKQIDSPRIFVYIYRNGIYKHCEYKNIYIDQTTGEPSTTISKDLVLSLPKLKKLYKHWINHSNSSLI